MLECQCGGFVIAQIEPNMWTASVFEVKRIDSFEGARFEEVLEAFLGELVLTAASGDLHRVDIVQWKCHLVDAGHCEGLNVWKLEA